MQNYALIKNGVVENVVIWDGEGDIFDDYTAVKLDGLTAGIGWTYDGEQFTAPPEPEPTPEELIAQAEAKKKSLIAAANDYMDNRQWPGKAALGRLTDAEKEQYNLWLDYLDGLEAVDTTSASVINWPAAPEV
ncbi:tail fiber assembly protein [Enterobacter kobei]|uniref:tail fiber assembly protein n=2 Tax=Enterobacteriaceae TaxID=543 RepID=UPI0013D45E33|nr:tail fiber assembly protein [Enterobacter kobei]EKS6745954.1 tail fiber assembly protein [Enterobacter kobei]ELE9694703.1 tail fiber assembly protein [Enterobacter kobei]ELU0837149.1 tail fiber assembly protein [Enterobacter kobei]